MWIDPPAFPAAISDATAFGIGRSPWLICSSRDGLLAASRCRAETPLDLNRRRISRAQSQCHDLASCMAGLHVDLLDPKPGLTSRQGICYTSPQLRQPG